MLIYFLQKLTYRFRHVANLKILTSSCLLLYFKICIYMIFFQVFAPIRTRLSFKFWWIIGRWIYKYVLCNKHKCYKTWFIAQYSKPQINFTIALVIHYLQFFCLVKSSTPNLFVLKYLIGYIKFKTFYT